jgi:hypothetical protein
MLQNNPIPHNGENPVFFEGVVIWNCTDDTDMTDLHSSIIKPIRYDQPDPCYRCSIMPNPPSF